MSSPKVNLIILSLSLVTYILSFLGTSHLSNLTKNFLISNEIESRVRYFNSILSLIFAMIDLVSPFENLSKFLTKVILFKIPKLVAIVLAICGYFGKYFSTKVSLLIS